MTPFRIRCRECSAKLTIRKPDAVGKKVRCPGCGGEILVKRPRQKEATTEPASASTRGSQESEGRPQRRRGQKRSRPGGAAHAKRVSPHEVTEPSGNENAKWVKVGVVAFTLLILLLGVARTYRRSQRIARIVDKAGDKNRDNATSRYPPIDGSLPPEQQARAAVAQMVKQLEAGDYADFLETHAPVDVYERTAKSESRPSNSGTAGLRDAVREMETWTFTVSPGSSKEVVLTDPTPDMAVPNRYKGIANWQPPRPGSGKPPGPPGYGRDLNKVLELAIADLRQGKYERFMERIFPRTVIAMMKVDQRWTSLAESLTPESPLVTRMIEDLTVMLATTPEMSGRNYALYKLPRRITVDGHERVVGTRIVVIGRTNSWRFIDGGRDFRQPYAVQLLAAKSPVSDAVLRKIDGRWRLKYMPH